VRTVCVHVRSYISPLPFLLPLPTCTPPTAEANIELSVSRKRATESIPSPWRACAVAHPHPGKRRGGRGERKGRASSGKIVVCALGLWSSPAILASILLLLMPAQEVKPSWKGGGGGRERGNEKGERARLRFPPTLPLPPSLPPSLPHLLKKLLHHDLSQ